MKRLLLASLLMIAAGGLAQAPAAPLLLTARAGSTASSDDWFTTECATASMCTSFETEGEVVDYTLADAAGLAGQATRDTTRKFSGSASMKFAMPEAGGSPNWFRHLDDAFGLYTGEGMQSGGVGNATDQGIDAPETFEFAYLIYFPDTILQGDDAGTKFSIVSHDRGSNQSFEVVWQDSLQEGLLNGYHRNPSNTTHWNAGVTTACAGGPFDFNRQPLIDHGANALTDLAAVNPDDMSAWTDCEKDWARYGGLYTYRTAGYPDAEAGTNIWKFWRQLGGEDNAIGSEPIGPVLLPRNDWIALKICVDLVSYDGSPVNRIRWYAGNRYNSDWFLVADQQNAILPTSDNGGGYNIRYNTVWLTLRRDAAAVVDTFANYDDLIFKRDTDCTGIGFPQTWPAL